MADVSFRTNIRPLFTQTDIDHMSGLGVELDSFDYMSQPANAEAVYEALAAKTMPPDGDGGPWSDDRIELFRSWMTGGYKP